MEMARFKKIKNLGGGVWIFSGQHNTLEHNHSRCLKSLIIKKNIYEIHNQSITSVAPKKQDFNKKTIWYSKEPEKLGE